MFEARIILRHAGTVLIGQLAVMSFGIADTLIAGRYDASALAALSVGSAIYISIYVSLNGLITAIINFMHTPVIRLRNASQESCHLRAAAKNLNLIVKIELTYPRLDEKLSSLLGHP